MTSDDVVVAETTKAKAWTSAAGTLVTALSAAFADDVLSGNETAGLVSTLILAGLSVYAVYRVPNKPVRTYRR